MREHRQWWPWRRGPAWGRRRVRGGGTVWPLAVGVVLVPQDFTAATRLEQRLALALGAYRRAAYRRGFFLLDLLDVPAWAVNPTRGWAPVWELADRTVPDAVIVYGGTSSEVPKPPGGLRGLPVHVLPPERP